MSGTISNPQAGSIRASENVLKIPAFRTQKKMKKNSSRQKKGIKSSKKIFQSKVKNVLATKIQVNITRNNV